MQGHRNWGYIGISLYIALKHRPNMVGSSNGSVPESWPSQVKGPLDTSNFDDFSGIDERFAIAKERHKAWSNIESQNFGRSEHLQGTYNP